MPCVGLGCRDSNPNYLIQNQIDDCTYSTVVSLKCPYSGDYCVLRTLRIVYSAVKLAVRVPYWLSGRKTRNDINRYIITLHNKNSNCSKRTFPGAHNLPNLLLLLVEHSNILIFSFRYCACTRLNIRTIRSIFPSPKSRTLVPFVLNVQGVVSGSNECYGSYVDGYSAYQSISRQGTPQQLPMVAPLMTMDHGALMATWRTVKKFKGYTIADLSGRYRGSPLRSSSGSEVTVSPNDHTRGALAIMVALYNQVIEYPAPFERVWPF